MRALVCKAFGPADQLVIEEHPNPAPGPGELVVSVQAAGINFPDHLMIQGLYQDRAEPPFVPGGECAGTVESVGEGVAGFAVGDPVIAMPQGGAFAERCTVPAALVLPMAAGMSYEQAAGFTVTYATSYHVYKQSARLQPGETVLVLGAAGGVGITAVELAKALGARVIAAASNDDKLAFTREAGADETVNYSEENLKQRVKELTDGRGVDVVYDPVGGELAEQALRATAWQGRYLVIGFASGTIPRLPANLPLLKEAAIIGVWWGTWAAKNPRESLGNMNELIAMVGAGTLKPRVTESFPLDRYVDAFAAITERRAKGKVVLTMT